jgi:hypothetical protein
MVNATANMTSLINDATRAGFSVETKGGETYIIKRVGRWKKATGLVIYGDGTAFDVTVENLGAAKGLRSYKDMRTILGI